jgi:hemerythrin superfamily protein
MRRERSAAGGTRLAHGGSGPAPAAAPRTSPHDAPHPRAHPAASQEITMPASKKSASRPAAKSSTEDVIKLLSADHKEVKALFKEYEKLVEQEADGDEKQALAEEICLMLTVHATVEEELFYPAAREALGEEEDLIDEAAVEHASAKELIAQIQDSSPDEELYDAKVKVLGEYIDHHVKEEEGEIFPKAKKAGLDTAAIGEQVASRKQELMAELSDERAAG